MSNARIANRLNAMADGVELGTASIQEFADELLGHTEALEGMAYSQLKEAQSVRAQLLLAVEQGEAQLVDVHALGDWLRGWVARIPSSSADGP